MATTRLINGVISVHILAAGRVYTNTVAIRASLESGGMNVTTRVLQDVRRVSVTKVTAAVRAKQASMEINAIKYVLPTV